MVHVYGASPRWRKDSHEAAKSMVASHSDAEAAIVLKMNRAKVRLSPCMKPCQHVAQLALPASATNAWLPINAA